MTVTWCPAFSAIAPRYAMPSGMNGGWLWAFGGYGGLISVIFIAVSFCACVEKEVANDYIVFLFWWNSVLHGEVAG